MLELIPATDSLEIDKLRRFTALCLEQPQVAIETLHIIHAGLYSRTIMIPKGVILTGALIKIATQLIISGDVIASIGNDSIRYVGFNVLPASANRKQAFLAQQDTFMTMIFPTDEKTIDAVESQFTDESDILFSRTNNNKVIITKE